LHVTPFLDQFFFLASVIRFVVLNVSPRITIVGCKQAPPTAQQHDKGTAAAEAMAI
jgi:hypothetical protein